MLNGFPVGRWEIKRGQLPPPPSSWLWCMANRGPILGKTHRHIYIGNRRETFDLSSAARVEPAGSDAGAAARYLANHSWKVEHRILTWHKFKAPVLMQLQRQITSGIQRPAITERSAGRERRQLITCSLGKSRRCRATLVLFTQGK